MKTRICPLPENSKENEDINDVELDHLIFDLIKVVSLRILQIMHSSRRAIPHPQGYTCHQCQHAQQGSVWPLTHLMCQSDLPQCAYVVFDVLFFTVLCFRQDLHKAVILFLKQLPHPWETLLGGGRESSLLK